MVDMYLGICRADITESNPPLGPYFDARHSNIGHGCYLIDSGGRAYSHTDAAVNYKPVAFSSTASDNVEMSYDPLRGRLTGKNGSK